MSLQKILLTDMLSVHHFLEHLLRIFFVKSCHEFNQDETKYNNSKLISLVCIRGTANLEMILNLVNK